MNSKNIVKSTAIFYFIFFVLLALLPMFSSSVYLSIATTFLVYAVASLSQDVILGRAGLYAMGQAMFVGLGAYVFAILINNYQYSFPAALLLALVVPLVVSIALALPIIHLRGDYFLVVTLGYNVIFNQIINNDPFNVTGGPNGIFSIAIANFAKLNFSSPTCVYYCCLVALLIVLILLRNLNYSRLGRGLYFVNQDELAARSVGANPAKLKLLAFAIGSVIAGLAGVMYVLNYGAVSPEGFSIQTSILLFAVVIVGGQGTLSGVLIGTFIMFVLPELFRGFADIRYLIFGITMVVLMIIRPGGIIRAKYGYYAKYLGITK